MYLEAGGADTCLFCSWASKPKSNIGSTSQTRNLIKKWKEDLNKHFSTETTQRPQKRCSISLITIFMCAHSCHSYWNGLPFPIPGDLPNPGIEPVSLVSPALGGGLFITSATWEGHSLTPKRASHWPRLVRIIKPCQTFLGLLWFLN